MPERREVENSRAEALRRLLRIEQEGAYIGLEDGLGGPFGTREARQSTELVAGVTRRRRRLDFILSRYSHVDLERMEPELRHILRIGLYDLLYLDTPPYAAVNEAVSLAKRKLRRGAGGLVNGVLRSVLRNRENLPAPDTGDPAEDLAILHSHPTWMVRRWLGRYGTSDTEALLEWNNARPAFDLRVNTLKLDVRQFQDRLSELGVAWEAGKYFDYFVRVQSLQPLMRAGLLRGGLCAVQDEGAGLVVRLLDPGAGERIVDACAAPGGKALHAAQRMNDEGEIIAIDVHEGRVGLVERAAREHGVHIVRTVVVDFREFDGAWTGRADRVLIDVPCSGLGVLSKRADLRWRRQESDVSALAELQDALLDAGARIVRPGGVLVYATCTIEPDENERRIEAFLARHAGFDVEPASEFVPRELATEAGFLETFPPRDGVDGVFGARLRRRP